MSAPGGDGKEEERYKLVKAKRHKATSCVQLKRRFTRIDTGTKSECASLHARIFSAHSIP